jgi:hypothetical protein
MKDTSVSSCNENLCCILIAALNNELGDVLAGFMLEIPCSESKGFETVEMPINVDRSIKNDCA